MRRPLRRWRDTSILALTVMAATLTAITGCASHPDGKVVLERGSANGKPWQLVASEQSGADGGLALFIDGVSQSVTYSGTVGFSNQPGGWYWSSGLGPGDSTFVYGPAPSTAVTAVLTAPGQPAITIPTRAIPDQDDLPAGRFFIVPVPRTTVWWNVLLKDAHGREVPPHAF